MLYRFLRHRRSILFILVFGVIFLTSSSYFDEALLNEVEFQAKQNIEKISNQILKEELAIIEDKKLIFYEYNKNDEIIKASLNTTLINEVELDTAKMFLDKLNEISTFNVEIPLGYLFTRKFYLTDGFKLKVKVSDIKAPKTYIKKTIESYGINSSLVSFYLVSEIEYLLKIPFQKRISLYETATLLCCDITHSKIPDYYINKLN